jgi:hypothetical protein
MSRLFENQPVSQPKPSGAVKTNMGKGEQKRGHAYPDNIHFYDEMYFNHSSPEFVPKAKDMLTSCDFQQFSWVRFCV